MISEVQWIGLTEMAFDLKVRKPRKMIRGIDGLTKDMMDMLHQFYVENLSGSVPSTAARPLPVGVRSGRLRAGAMKRQINQYACEVSNTVYYAGFIEVGTRKMAPRRPLGDAVDKLSQMVPGKLGKVLTTILIEE
jgi:hypothetical protein